MAQKIEIKVEAAFATSKELYFCLYVDDKFLICPWKVADADKRECKKWLKETTETIHFQDRLRFEKEIKEGTYTIAKNGLVYKTTK